MEEIKPTFRVEGTSRGLPEVKRLHLPGIILKSDCPRCGRECSVDLADEYLSYGEAEATFYCGGCERAGVESDWTICFQGEVRLLPLDE